MPAGLWQLLMGAEVLSVIVSDSPLFKFCFIETLRGKIDENKSISLKYQLSFCRCWWVRGEVTRRLIRRTEQPLKITGYGPEKYSFQTKPPSYVANIGKDSCDMELKHIHTKPNLLPALPTQARELWKVYITSSILYLLIESLLKSETLFLWWSQWKASQ